MTNVRKSVLNAQTPEQVFNGSVHYVFMKKKIDMVNYSRRKCNTNK